MIIDLQRRIAEVGRIRIGHQIPAGKGTRPAKLDTFRLTSPDKTKIVNAARIYGGHIIYRGSIGIGLASRVQNDVPFDTFTVRYTLHNGNTTEYARHLKQLSTEGALKPLYWCHSYVSPKGELLRSAVAKTADVIAAVGDTSMGGQRPVYDGNTLWWIDWKKFRDSGAWIWIWENDTWTLPRTSALPKQERLF